MTTDLGSENYCGSNAPFPGIYDPSTGRPAWHESNILMSVSVRIDGRLFAAWEMFDPMLFSLQFGDTEDERFEHFVKYYDSATPAPWPCRTFEAMEDTADA